MKKYISVICALLIVATFCLTACGEQPAVFETEWTYDAAYHWHDAVSKNGETADKAKHDFSSEIVVEDGELYEKRVCECGYTVRKAVDYVGNFVESFNSAPLCIELESNVISGKYYLSFEDDGGVTAYSVDSEKKYVIKPSEGLILYSEGDDRYGRIVLDQNEIVEKIFGVIVAVKEYLPAISDDGTGKLKDLLKTVIKNDFLVKTPTENGFVISADKDKYLAIISDMYRSKLKDGIDKIVGEGTYDAAVKFAGILFNTKIGTLSAILKLGGFDSEQTIKKIFGAFADSGIDLGASDDDFNHWMRYAENMTVIEIINDKYGLSLEYSEILRVVEEIGDKTLPDAVEHFVDEIKRMITEDGGDPTAIVFRLPSYEETEKKIKGVALTLSTDKYGKFVGLSASVDASAYGMPVGEIKLSLYIEESTVSFDGLYEAAKKATAAFDLSESNYGWILTALGGEYGFSSEWTVDAEDEDTAYIVTGETEYEGTMGSFTFVIDLSSTNNYSVYKTDDPLVVKISPDEFISYAYYTENGTDEKTEITVEDILGNAIFYNTASGKYSVSA